MRIWLRTGDQHDPGCRQVLHETVKPWSTCDQNERKGAVLGAGTTRNSRIVGYLARYRNCRASLRGRCYTKRSNLGVPAARTREMGQFGEQVLHETAESWGTCHRGGEIAVAEPRWRRDTKGHRGTQKLKSGGRASRAVSPDLLWSASQFGLQCHL